MPPSGFEDLILRVLADSPNGVSTQVICRAAGVSPQQLGDSFEALKSRAAAVGFAGLWFSPDAFRLSSEAFCASLGQMHTKFERDTWFPALSVVVQAKLPWAGKPLQRIVARLAADGLIESDDDLVRIVRERPVLSLRQRGLLGRVIGAIEAAPVNTPPPVIIARQIGVPQQAVEEIVRLAVLTGDLISIGEGVLYSPAQLEGLEPKVRAVNGGRAPTASKLRDELGTTRKYAIALLQHFFPLAAEPGFRGPERDLEFEAIPDSLESL